MAPLPCHQGRCLAAALQSGLTGTGAGQSSDEMVVSFFEFGQDSGVAPRGGSAAPVRHPVELVLQVVARACWALESTANRHEIITVQRSRVDSCFGFIEVDSVKEPPARSPIRASLAAPDASPLHWITSGSPRSG